MTYYVSIFLIVALILVVVWKRWVRGFATQSGTKNLTNTQSPYWDSVRRRIRTRNMLAPVALLVLCGAAVLFVYLLAPQDPTEFVGRWWRPITFTVLVPVCMGLGRYFEDLSQHNYVFTYIGYTLAGFSAFFAFCLTIMIWWSNR